MIVTETDSKTSSPSDNESRSTAAPSPFTAPPAYQLARPTADSFPSTPPTRPLVELKSRDRVEPACRRFFEAFCFAALIYTLSAVIYRSLVSPPARPPVEGVPPGPRREDGRIVICLLTGKWTSQADHQRQSALPPYLKTLTLPLPVSSGFVFFRSRGSYGHGTVKFELSDQSGDEIMVDIALGYYTLTALGRGSICLLERDEGGQGVGIFTPESLQPESLDMTERITFDITVRFPRSGSAMHPLVINALETDMGSWDHHVASLEDRVVFRSLSLNGFNSSIRAESISAKSASFTTSNKPITGSFNVSDSLTLITSNAAITANIRLENRDGNKATRLQMTTSNGRIQTPLTLVSTDSSSSSAPTAFSVIATTSNSPLMITFPEAPVSPFSHLTLHGATSNSAANIKLHPTYEGSISLTTSLLNPEVVQKSTSDPSGQGRQRNVEVRRVVRGALSGGVWWGNDPNKEEGKGTVVITTSNARNMVELG